MKYADDFNELCAVNNSPTSIGVFNTLYYRDVNKMPTWAYYSLMSDDIDESLDSEEERMLDDYISSFLDKVHKASGVPRQELGDGLVTAESDWSGDSGNANFEPHPEFGGASDAYPMRIMVYIEDGKDDDVEI